MTRYLLTAFACFFLLLTGCRKTELTGQPSVSSTDRTSDALASKAAVSPDHWWGHYDLIADPNAPGGGDIGDPDFFSLDSAAYIHDGMAALTSNNSMPDYFSRIAFFIPAQYQIPGDNISLEVAAQNLYTNSIGDYDIVLELIGSLHTVQVHFVAHSAFTPYTEYSIGSIVNTNLPSLVYYFGSFQKIKLETKKGKTAVYVNNNLLYSFTYKADNKIGNIREVHLMGEGLPSFDYVKLTNSTTNKKKMTEDFNITGRSHTIFY